MLDLASSQIESKLLIRVEKTENLREKLDAADIIKDSAENGLMKIKKDSISKMQ